MRNLGQHVKVADVKNTYEQIASSYNRVRAKPWKECLNFIERFNSDGWVLDVGCGSGRHIVASISRGHETIGIDFSENMLKIAHQKLKEFSSSIYHLVLADASHLPFKRDSFAYILHIATLHNLPHRSLRVRSLEEAKRVLRSGGICLISVWKRLQFRFLLKAMTAYLRKIVGLGGNFEVLVPWKKNGVLVYRYFYLYSAGQLEEDIKDAGMDILSFSKVKIGAKVMSDNYFVAVTKASNVWKKE